MAWDYVDLRDNVAFPLVRDAGQPLTVFRTVDTVTYEKKYDPVTMSYYWEDDLGNTYPEEPAETQVEYSGYCIPRSYVVDKVDGTLIQADDLMLIAVGIPRPQAGDIFRVDGVDYQHVRLENVSPGGTDIVYRIQVRK